MRRRRRPLRRAAMVGGLAYGAGATTQGGREQALPAPGGGLSGAALTQLEQLEQLTGARALTQDELDAQRESLPEGS